jgi:hypothetical protein
MEALRAELGDAEQGSNPSARTGMSVTWSTTHQHGCGHGRLAARARSDAAALRAGRRLPARDRRTRRRGLRRTGPRDLCAPGQDSFRYGTAWQPTRRMGQHQPVSWRVAESRIASVQCISICMSMIERPDTAAAAGHTLVAYGRAYGPTGLRAYGPAVFGRRWLKLPARVADSETMIRCPHPPEPHLQRGPAFTS